MASEQPTPSSSRPKAGLIVAAVLAVLCLVVFFQNLEVVTVQLFFWPVSMAKIVLMLLMLLIGLIFGWVLAMLRYNRTRSDNKENR